MRVPAYYRNPKVDSLSRCVDRTAGRLEMSPHRVAEILTQLFEEIEHQLSRGHCVSIPLFGMLLPLQKPPRKKRRQGGAVWCCPARSLSNEVFSSTTTSHVAYPLYKKRRLPDGTLERVTIPPRKKTARELAKEKLWRECRERVKEGLAAAALNTKLSGSGELAL